VARITHLLLSAVGSSVIVFPASWLIASILTLWML
jgi:hypothetical protein